jgi:glycosyltransferase involved in cell wall biosynthesis
LKIVHVGPTNLPLLHPFGGAVERRMVEFAACQTSQGHEVRIFSADRNSRVDIVRGFKVQSIAVRLPRPWRDYEMLVKVYLNLKRNPADVLHVHGVPDGGRLGSALGVPTVLSFDYFAFRGSRTWFGRRYYLGTLRRYSKLLAVSESCRTMFRDYWGDPSPIGVLPNGVNPRQFRPDEELGATFRRQFGLAGKIVLYVGRLCEQKGTNVLLEAWRLMGPRPDATLVLVGPNAQFGDINRSKMVDEASDLNVIWLGAVDESKLSAVYNMCDLFVMPTTRDEMFGMAALEAQSCGKPVVASRLGGLLEVVSEKAGIFVTPGDEIELACALESGLDGSMNLSKCGAAGREHALTFSWERVSANLEREYLDVVR